MAASSIANTVAALVCEVEPIASWREVIIFAHLLCSLGRPQDANDLLEHARGSLCDTQYEDLEIQRAFQEAINGVQQAVAAAKSVARNALERAEVGIDGTMAAEEAATADKLEMVWKPPSDAACSMPTMETAGADDVAALEGPVLEQEPSDLHAEVFSKPQPKFHGYDVPLTAPGTRSKESENDLVCLWT